MISELNVSTDVTMATAQSKGAQKCLFQKQKIFPFWRQKWNQQVLISHPVTLPIFAMFRPQDTAF